MSVVLYERRGPAAWITLNRPEKLNALSYELVRELRAAIARAADDDEAKVVVLTGAGRAFSAGFDLSEEAESRVEGAERWRRILEDDVAVTLELWSLPKPTIAAVRGWCVAGGCSHWRGVCTISPRPEGWAAAARASEARKVRAPRNCGAG